VFLICLNAGAQVITTGQIAGTVVDPSGAVVPGATVTVTQPSTGFTQSVSTNVAGEYVFLNLLPGNYQLAATASGFAVASYTDVVVEAARTKNVQIQMKIGKTSQTIEVSAQGTILETTTNTLANTINPDAVQDLPLAGRDLLPLALLVPGAESGGDLRFTTYNSLPNAAVNITIDGMNANSQRYRTSTTGFFTFAPMRLGAFDEVTVSTSELTADAGAEGSTQVRFVTKHGTNQFHGNAFWQAINSTFDANSFNNNALGITKPHSVLNDWGGSLGGPFLKNRLFFFVNFEGDNQNPSSLTSNEIPTPQAQQGNFNYIGTDGAQHSVNVLSLAAANGFPSSINSVIGPMLSSINSYSAKGTLSPAAGLPYVQYLSFTQSDSIRERYPTARLDWQIKPSLAWHGTWDMYWRDIANTEQYYPGDPVLNNGFKSTYYIASNGLDWTVSPQLINKFLFGIQSNVEEFNPGNNSNVFQSQGNLEIEAPYLANQGTTPVFQPLIPSFVIPIPRNNPVWSVADNLLWSHGKHSFNFGGDVRWADSHELEINSPPTQYLGLSSVDPALAMFTPSNFPAISPANGNQDLLNAQALYATLVGRINDISGYSWVDTTTHQYRILGHAVNWEKQRVGGIYFQDSWRTTPHFTLNYGLRWQFTGAVYNSDNLWTSPTLADLLGPSTALFQPGVLNGDLNPSVYLRPHPYGGDFNGPSPNLGFAWNPTLEHGLLGKLAGRSNLVIRGGAAISHYDEGWVPMENATLFTNPGGTQYEFLYPGFGSGLFPPGSLSLGSPFTLNTFPTSFTFPQPQSEFFPDESYATVDPNIRSPYVETWNFGIERKLPGNNVLEINYVGNHALRAWMAYDLNETNIFENGFLQEFKNAVTDLAINGGTTFADSTGLPGLVPLPIFEAAFGGTGAAAGSTNALSSFSNPNFIALLQEGQAGALANALATSPTFLCNMVGSTFSPCGGYGLTGAGKYPMNFFQVNPFAAGGTLTYLSDPGSESYNGLQVQLKRQGHGLTFNANYTYSHSLTNRYLGDYYTADSALVNYITLRDPGLSKGPSPYDLRNVFRAYMTYDLPFGAKHSLKTGNRALDQVIGGWTLGTIVTAQSGRNFKLQSDYNTYNYSNAYWPDASDSGVVLNGISRRHLQNQIGVYNGPNANEPVVFLPQQFNFSAIGPETNPGQLGQMIFLNGPALINADISVVKSFSLKEHVRLNIYAEFLNAFNHPNWTVIDNYAGGTNNPAEYAVVTSSTFTKLSPANTPRNIQFRLQLAF
jgi:hypothetical protein